MYCPGAPREGEYEVSWIEGELESDLATKRETNIQRVRESAGRDSEQERENKEREVERERFVLQQRFLSNSLLCSLAKN